MTKTIPAILALMPCAALLASCGAKPTPTPPMTPVGATLPASNIASPGSQAAGGQAMVVPSNPNRPANIPALGIPANARRSHASGQ